MVLILSKKKKNISEELIGNLTVLGMTLKQLRKKVNVSETPQKNFKIISNVPEKRCFKSSFRNYTETQH